MMLIAAALTQSADKSDLDREAAALRETVLAQEASGFRSKRTGIRQLGVALQHLNVNDVSARLDNTGSFFRCGLRPMYNVPITTDSMATSVYGTWIGGMVDVELHVAASDCGPWEFRSGRLDENGNRPALCSQ